MGIRIANDSDMHEVAKKQKENNVAKQELNVSEAELNLLYSKAMREIDSLESDINYFKKVLENFFFAEDIFELDLVNLFFESLKQLTKKQLPAFLEGDCDIINEISDGELDEDAINDIRISIYQKLSKKYLNQM